MDMKFWSSVLYAIFILTSGDEAKNAWRFIKCLVLLLTAWYWGTKANLLILSDSDGERYLEHVPGNLVAPVNTEKELDEYVVLVKQKLYVKLFSFNTPLFLLSVFCKTHTSPIIPTIPAIQRPHSILLRWKQPHRSESAMQITGFQYH
jgi:hypothetical protein